MRKKIHPFDSTPICVFVAYSIHPAFFFHPSILWALNQRKLDDLGDFAFNVQAFAFNVQAVMDSSCNNFSDH